MPPTTRQDLALPGCTVAPLMAYLKAVGILRLVAEQKDPEASGWWKDDAFWLRSQLDEDSLLSFFVTEYVPTPIVAPWAGGSGFFNKDNKAAVNAISLSSAPRLRPYRKVIENVRAVIKSESIAEKPKEGQKARLILRYRSELSDEVVGWMDAAMAILVGGQAFAPVLGTGGNDGRLDFTQNFMQRLVSLDLHKTDTSNERSRGWLGQSLLARPARLSSASVGQFAPGRAGGPNATQGMEGKPIDNPWDFILMLEGALILAAAAVRRLGRAEGSRASFPFTVRAVAAGFNSEASGDEVESRGELWLPVWKSPAGLRELRQIFGEGRVEVSGRRARDGTDFARAVASLGVDRGISTFTRYSILKRSGKAFLATPVGSFVVAERPGTELLRELDPWLDRFRRASRTKNAPPRFGAGLRRIESAIFQYCRRGGERSFQDIIRALGAAERELVTAERFRKEHQLTPIDGLSAEWIRTADDQSREFAIARALAAVHDPDGRVVPLRANVEPVDTNGNTWSWAERNPSAVWSAAALPVNLANILSRRMMDGVRYGCQHIPIWSRSAVRLDAIASFLAGDLDEELVEGLIWGLVLINGTSAQGTPDDQAAHGSRFLPRQYALMKLLHLPGAIAVDHKRGEFRWRFARDGEPSIAIRPERRILPLLRALRTGDACTIAAQRLRASGLPPMPGPLPGGYTRDRDWSDAAGTSLAAARLAAALLIPISTDSVDDLVRLVCRAEVPAAAEMLANSAQGDAA